MSRLLESVVGTSPFTTETEVARARAVVRASLRDAEDGVLNTHRIAQALSTYFGRKIGWYHARAVIETVPGVWCAGHADHAEFHQWKLSA